jgi:hypothetical protein
MCNNAINKHIEIRLVSMSFVAENAMQNIVNNLNHKLYDNVVKTFGLFERLKPPNNPWYITRRVKATPYFLKIPSTFVNPGIICNI